VQVEPVPPLAPLRGRPDDPGVAQHREVGEHRRAAVLPHRVAQVSRRRGRAREPLDDLASRGVRQGLPDGVRGHVRKI